MLIFILNLLTFLFGIGAIFTDSTILFAMTFIFLFLAVTFEDV